MNELTEQKAAVVSEKLKAAIGDGVPQEGIREQLAEKLKNATETLPQTLKAMETQPGIINAVCLDAANTALALHLTRAEMDYMLIPMYEESHDVNQLRCATLFARLEQDFPDLSKQFKHIVPAAKADDEGKKEQKEVATNEGSLPLKMKGGMNEDQMIEVAQRCFYAIAEQMSLKKLSIAALYEDVIFKKKVEGEEVELISPLDFLNGLRKLGIDDFQSLDYTCLVKVLSINDKEKLIRVSDLVQILEDYGITEQNSVEEQLVSELRFEDLDKVSMVLMLALTEYMVKAKAPLYELFGGTIYKQEVQVDAKQVQVDLVNSTSFFDVLRGIGICAEEREHDNLKRFLCLDANYPDKLMVRKVKRAIEEFAVNEELRAFAQHCYQELANSDQLEDVKQPQGRDLLYSTIALKPG